MAAAAVSRFASLIGGVHEEALLDSGFAAIAERDVRDGQHRAGPDGAYFTTAFFHHPDELRQEALDAGLSNVEIVAIEGPWSFMPDLLERHDDPVRWAAVLRAIESIEREPSLMGASRHFIAVGRR